MSQPAFNPVRQAVQNMNGLNFWRRSSRFCWKCQQDRRIEGGQIKRIGSHGGGVMRFLCQDCLPPASNDE